MVSREYEAQNTVCAVILATETTEVFARGSLYVLSLTNKKLVRGTRCHRYDPSAMRGMHTTAVHQKMVGDS